MRDEALWKAKYAAALRQSETPQNWFLQVGGDLGIRARRILNGIAASVRRYEAVMIAKQGRSWEKHLRNYVVFCDWEFEIRVREKTVTNRRPNPENYGNDRYMGTGKLCVDVDSEYAKWIDGRMPLEDKVDLVADYLIRHLNKLRVGWAELREWEEQREAAKEEALRRRREDDGYESVLARILELHQRMATELSKLPPALTSA